MFLHLEDSEYNVIMNLLSVENQNEIEAVIQENNGQKKARLE